MPQSDVRIKGTPNELCVEMARQALRVLGLAYCRPPEVPDLESGPADPDLVWVGLAGLIDPPRPEARQAVEHCRQAGIRVIMVTGDHPVTASAVAREVGLIPRGEESHAVITGPEFNQLSDPELTAALREVRVFALFLHHVPLDQLPAETVGKIKSLEINEEYHLLCRNLSMVIERPREPE